MFLHHVLVELCFHRHGLGLPTPSLTQQCELTAHVEVKRRCFSPPPRLSQPASPWGSRLWLLFLLQFVSSFQETELESSCVGCTVLSYW